MTHTSTTTNSYLVNERSKAVVEALDLLFLLSADSLDGRVDVDAHGRQQALVHSDGSDGGLMSHATAKSTAKATAETHTHGRHA